MSERIYEMVTERIIAELEKGNIPWRKPWTDLPQPMNMVTKRPYQGVNQILLSCLPFSSPFYLTFRQARELGGSVRKGEKATPVVFWKFVEVDTDDPSFEEGFKRVPLLRYYNVFNIAQVDGIAPEKIPAIDDAPSRDFEPIEAAEKIFRTYFGGEAAPALVHAGSEACYLPILDAVRMPPRERFHGEAAYYGTLAHEAIHSTGHRTRLNRPAINGAIRFGSKTDYGREELCAEVGSALILESLGIENTIENAAGYIQSWLRALKDDKKMLVIAAGQAAKAADMVLGRCQKEEVEDEN